MGNPNSFKLIPDWQEPKALVLVWPVQVYRKYLLQFYARFVSYLPDHVKVICLVKDMGIEKEVRASIKAYSQRVQIQCLVIPDISDIWIRDWGPIPAVDSTGKKAAIKAIYKPGYLSKSATYKVMAFADDIAGRKLTALLGLPVIDIPLIWDIGNLTHNGEGTAIITERLIEDNKNTFSEAEIRALLKERLNLTKLIILQVEPGDETGHIDGMVRFLDPKTVAVGAYSSGWIEGKHFINRIARTLKRELGPKYTILRVPHGTPPDEGSENIPSAVGNHINFLRVGDKLLLPMYGIKEDEKAINALRKYLSPNNVIPVNILGLKVLASKGGVLNCMTWNLF